jgi:hypothetical protein
METRHLVLLALGLTLVSASAAAETTVFRPGPCAAQTSYLLASNSGALIRVEPETSVGQEASAGYGNPVIVFRYQPTDGWASQRLLRRFDLQLGRDGARISNSGAFCIGGR